MVSRLWMTVRHMLKAWASNNNMMLNANVYITSQFRQRNESVSLHICGDIITATNSARDIGVLLMTRWT